MLRLFIALLILSPSLAMGQPVISELRQSGAEFVELHNPTDQVINLQGYHLTGDVPHSFYETSRLPAGGYLVLVLEPERFAREFPDVPVAGLVSARLKNEGSELRLYDPDWKLVDRVRYGKVKKKHKTKSLQRISAKTAYRGPLNWKRAKPTPGAPNAVADRVPALALDLPTREPERPTSKDRVEVRVRVQRASQLERVSLVWSTLLRGGGTVPLERVGTERESEWGIYAGHIPAIPNQTLVSYRFVAEGKQDGDRQELKEAEWGGDPLRYFVSNDVKTRFPLYCIEIAPQVGRKLLGKKPGRTRHDAALVAIEDGVAHIRSDVTIQVRGGPLTRLYPKRGWIVNFDQPLRGQERINLRSNWDDATCLREILALDLYRKLGVPAPRARVVRVHINGRFFGLFQEVEHVDAGFLARNGLAGGVLYKPELPAKLDSEDWCDGRAYEALPAYETRWTKKTFEDEPYTDLRDFIQGYHDCPDGELEAWFAKHLDVERYVQYLAVGVVVSHWDSVVKNFYWCLDRQGSGKWVVIPWDLDQTWGAYFVQNPGLFPGAPVLQGTKAHPVREMKLWNRMRDRFLTVEAHRDRLYRAVLELLEGEFQPKTITARLDAFHRASEREVLEDRRRWGGLSRAYKRLPFSPRWIAQELELFKRYLVARRAFLLKACREHVPAPKRSRPPPPEREPKPEPEPEPEPESSRTETTLWFMSLFAVLLVVVVVVSRARRGSTS